MAKDAGAIAEVAGEMRSQAMIAMRSRSREIPSVGAERASATRALARSTGRDADLGQRAAHVAVLALSVGVARLARGLGGGEAALRVGAAILGGLAHRLVGTCVGPEQCSCSEHSERAERSEHVWPQIVQNIWPKSVKISPKSAKITPNHQRPQC